MKIYLFNPENGVYLGEDFADEAAMRRGKYLIPSDATTVAPPQIEKGQVLIFNTEKRCWDVHLRPVKNVSMGTSQSNNRILNNG